MNFRIKYRFFIVAALAFVMVLGSCASNKNTYPYKKKKKKNCDCPDWTYQEKATTNNNTLVLS